MKVSERLLARLRELPGLDIPEGAVLKSLRPSGSQRNLGAWSWTVCTSDGLPVYKGSDGRALAVGSQWPMSELLKLGMEANGPDCNGDVTIEPPSAVQHQGITAESSVPGRLLAKLRNETTLDIPPGARAVSFNTTWRWILVDSTGTSLQVGSRRLMSELLKHDITARRDPSGFVRIELREREDSRE